MKWMERVSTHGLMEEGMKVATRMTKSMGRASTPGLMEGLMMDLGKMESSMVMAPISIQTLDKQNAVDGRTGSVWSGILTEVTQKFVL